MQYYVRYLIEDFDLEYQEKEIILFIPNGLDIDNYLNRVLSHKQGFMFVIEAVPC